MKIFPEPNLWKDPIGWAKTMGGVRYKFWLQVFVHVLIGAITVFVYTRGTFSPGHIIMIVFFLVVMPLGYLYVIRKLLLELQKREKIQVGKDTE
jgi:ACR3 family arsenite efflux pump ArsB